MESVSLQSPQAAQSLIKRKQQQSIATFKDSLMDGQNPITQFLQSRKLSPELDPVAFYTSVSSPGTLSILPEINYKSKTGFIKGLPPPEIMGGVLRDAGAKGIVVSLHEKSAAVPTTDFRRFTHEQSKARIFLPGPIPIVWNDVVVDKIQIVHAASMGASAITLHAYYSEGAHGSTAGLFDFVKCCHEYQIEPIVMASTVQEGLEAIAVGARCICLHSQDEAGLLAVREQLPDRQPGTDSPVLYIARLRAEADFSIYAEIDTSWALRDQGGFAAVWPSPEAVYTTGMGDIYPIITAMRSKASREFLSPRQFIMDRKNEGATEYLGDILY